MTPLGPLEPGRCQAHGAIMGGTRKCELSLKYGSVLKLMNKKVADVLKQGALQLVHARKALGPLVMDTENRHRQHLGSGMVIVWMQRTMGRYTAKGALVPE